MRRLQVTQVFRTLLLSDVVLTTASIVTGMQGRDDAPGHSPESLLFVGASVAVLVAWVVALAGLWRFRNWARFLYVALACVGLLAALLLGSEGTAGLKHFLNTLCWLVTGAIIALMYGSPLASVFRGSGEAA